MVTESDRLAEVRKVLEDPPRVHRQGALTYKTHQRCYEFLAEASASGSRTLETGLGISTVLFAAWKTEHICIVPDQDEVDRLLDYCDGVRDSAGITFLVEPSDLALPHLVESGHKIDLLFIDGGHGYPTPTIDWHYGNLMLKPGGICVIDDIQLPHVHDYLARFLLRDPRWEVLAHTTKWLAVRKGPEVPDREDWDEQPFVHFESSLHRASSAAVRLLPKQAKLAIRDLPIAQRIARAFYR